MPMESQEALFRSEEKHKEEVYETFDSMTSSASQDVRQKQGIISKGSFDDKEGFMMHGELSLAQKKRHQAEQLVSKLYDSPYFAHIEASFNDGTDCKEDYYLSDCESLNEIVNIGSTGTLIPFKQDPARPISGALFHCYQSKKGESVSYKGPQGEVFSFIPQLICNTEIWRRKLKDVVSLFPQMDVSQITADELLELKLQENRNNPILRNIISTLQRMQFEIIETGTSQSFVVQGCAGSGKSQCMLHRLFYLRDVLSESGWDKVLLVTPTKLFRQYSSELIRRYQLSDIYNCSISDLYREILFCYDDRFKERQYAYQMTEEYLSDEYLHEVYQEDNVRAIESEIDRAILGYVKMGCDALGIKIPERITHFEVEILVKELQARIDAFDESEKTFQDNAQYQDKKTQYEDLTKVLESLKKRLLRYSDDLNKCKENQQEYAKLGDAVKEAENERAQWFNQREKRISDAIAELDVLSRRVERGTDIQAPAKYAHQIYVVKDITEGNRYREDQEYLEFLEEYCAQANSDFIEKAGDKNINNVNSKMAKRQNEIELHIVELQHEIQEKEELLEELEEWLRNEKSRISGVEEKGTLKRSEMERARYFLARIESAVFESEVWNALSPVKERYNVQTLMIEQSKDGKRKETKILYKSDLLFYVKIYMKLRSNENIPEYKLICIDEGQDLHRADYDILKGIYPKATLNVFGDVGQVLHSACGISNWSEQTGISDVRYLTTNYRNTAAIADFCNKRFGVEMEFIGNVAEAQKPIIVSEASSIRGYIFGNETVVVVKDRTEYENLCEEAGIKKEELTFLDTMSEKSEERRKECYSIFAAKGLEFKNVFVYAKSMTKNQKVVACTRAMGGLYYYE